MGFLHAASAGCLSPLRGICETRPLWTMSPLWARHDLFNCLLKLLAVRMGRKSC